MLRLQRGVVRNSRQQAFCVGDSASSFPFCFCGAVLWILITRQLHQAKGPGGVCPDSPNPTLCEQIWGWGLGVGGGAVVPFGACLQMCGTVNLRIRIKIIKCIAGVAGGRSTLVCGLLHHPFPHCQSVPSRFKDCRC